MLGPGEWAGTSLDRCGREWPRIDFPGRPARWPQASHYGLSTLVCHFRQLKDRVGILYVPSATSIVIWWHCSGSERIAPICTLDLEYLEPRSHQGSCPPSHIFLSEQVILLWFPWGFICGSGSKYSMFPSFCFHWKWRKCISEMFSGIFQNCGSPHYAEWISWSLEVTCYQCSRGNQ